MTSLSRLASLPKNALIPYITAGDPHPDHTVTLMHALVAAGADALELGVPFSDPMADGPTIQLACERALAHGTSLHHVFAMVKAFRSTNAHTPVVLMGYLNPVEAMTPSIFAKHCAESGVDGVLLVDLAVEEAESYVELFRAQGLDTVFLIAPTSPIERIRAAAALGSGYVYYVSLKGVTGAANLDMDSVSQKVAEIRTATALPIAVGFGVRDAATAKAVGSVADAVIVGSMLVAEIERLQATPEAIPAALQAKLAPLKAALAAL
jgi:tryptophan synthase alpha chain